MNFDTSGPCGRSSKASALSAFMSLAMGVLILGLARGEEPCETVVTTAAGKPAEGSIEPFLGEPRFDKQPLFVGERFPNVVVATDGTVLATWGRRSYKVRRSEDGGTTWGSEITIREPGFHAGGAIVDERSGDVLVFVDETHPPRTPQKTMGPLRVFRSADHGRSWEEVDVVIHPNEKGHVPSMHMSEAGVTLRHGKHAGRLLRPARVYDRPEGAPRSGYNTAIYSDDGGNTWRTSSPFPDRGTGEGAVAELTDGRIYYSSRKNFFYEQVHEYCSKRRFAFSYDGGETWQDLGVSDALPDGPRYRGAERRGANYNGHFGMMAGLARLPVVERDILLYSNADTPCHERIRITVWASFDGGETWPIKRLVFEGPGAYSSLAVGRPQTPSEGWIYLLFEGGPEGMYSAVLKDATLRALSAAEFPLLVANVEITTDLLPPVAPYTVLQMDNDLTIAVLGLGRAVTKEEVWARDPIATAREYVHLADEHDIFVALTHIGYRTDQQLAEAVGVNKGGPSPSLGSKGHDPYQRLPSTGPGLGGASAASPYHRHATGLYRPRSELSHPSA